MVYKYLSYLQLYDMSSIISTPNSYSDEFIQRNRVFPLVDAKLESLIRNVLDQKLTPAEHNFLDIGTQSLGIDPNLTRHLFSDFKILFQQKLESSKLNSLTNLSQAKRVDICCGCTQFIDNLYMKYGRNGVQVMEGEYNYHARINPHLRTRTIKGLTPDFPLIISQPFYTGSTHYQMAEILDRCAELNIPVHIDGAWITACKNINVDFSHPAIESFAVSMSKGYGLSGWNRIGLRWTKIDREDSITVMNDFLQIPAQAVAVGLYFLNNIDIDHLWNTHKDRYYKICTDFNLEPTDTIHAVREGDLIRGVGPLIRHLESVSGN